MTAKVDSTAPFEGFALPPESKSGKAMGCVVAHVYAGSPAARLGLQVGDRIFRVNGEDVVDMIDLWFHGSDDRVKLEWERPAADGAPVVMKKSVKKAFHERLGIEVEPFEIRRCSNYCVFCFVHQNPRGMRRELYLKDEDYRLSFLYGNYITGTNLSQADRERIIRLRLSPIYFSIHATDQVVREQLLAKSPIEPIVPLLRGLTAQGITIHGQVVLCPGINDGAVLEKTALDLAELYPGVESVAVVPLGLTEHRARLPKLRDVTPEYAREFIAHVESVQKKVKRRIGFPLIFPSDEWYLIAGTVPPAYEDHPELPQLGNGVGMYFRFYEELAELRGQWPKRLPAPQRLAVLTTSLGLRVIQPLLLALEEIEGLTLTPIVITNTVFGEGITVTGLLPGCDFESAIRDNPGYDRYLLPDNALRSWDRRFIDDMTFDELVAKTNAEIRTGGDTARSFVEAALDGLI